MHLEGSCHCGKVTFSVEAYAPLPYLRCYCSICRKTQGGGGYAINLGAWKKTLKVQGREHLKVYRAKGTEGDPKHKSSGRRHFCAECGSALWLYDPGWPELVHPFASAIDTPLPTAPEHVEIMLSYKPDWVPLPRGRKGDARYNAYPVESLADWHRRHGYTIEEPPAREKSQKRR